MRIKDVDGPSKGKCWITISVVQQIKMGTVKCTSSYKGRSTMIIAGFGAWWVDELAIVTILICITNAFSIVPTNSVAICLIALRTSITLQESPKSRMSELSQEMNNVSGHPYHRTTYRMVK